MVPPLRYPLLHLHGVLGPRHRWRARVVPRHPESHAGCTKSAPKKNEARGMDEARRDAATFAEQGVPRGDLLPPSAPPGTGEVALVPRAEVAPASTLLATGEASQVAPNILYPASAPRRMRRARLAQYGRPRAGARWGGSVSSPARVAAWSVKPSRATHSGRSNSIGRRSNGSAPRRHSGITPAISNACTRSARVDGSRYPPSSPLRKRLPRATPPSAPGLGGPYRTGGSCQTWSREGA